MIFQFEHLTTFIFHLTHLALWLLWLSNNHIIFNILSIRSEHYALPGTIMLKPITHLLVLMLTGGNIGDGGEQGKRECFCYFSFHHQFHIIGLALIDNLYLEKHEEKKESKLRGENQATRVLTSTHQKCHYMRELVQSNLGWGKVVVGVENG